MGTVGGGSKGMNEAASQPMPRIYQVKYCKILIFYKCTASGLPTVHTGTHGDCLPNAKCSTLPCTNPQMLNSNPQMLNLNPTLQCTNAQHVKSTNAPLVKSTNKWNAHCCPNHQNIQLACLPIHGGRITCRSVPKPVNLGRRCRSTVVGITESTIGWLVVNDHATWYGVCGKILDFVGRQS